MLIDHFEAHFLDPFFVFAEHSICEQWLRFVSFLLGKEGKAKNISMPEG